MSTELEVQIKLIESHIEMNKAQARLWRVQARELEFIRKKEKLTVSNQYNNLPEPDFEKYPMDGYPGDYGGV